MQETKRCLGDSREEGSSGETQSDLDAYFVTLSLSLSMRRNLLVKGEGAPLGRRPACVKVQKSLVYSSTAFKGVKEGAVSGAKEKSQRKR